MGKKFCCTDKMNMYEMCTYCYNAFFTDPDFEFEMFEDYKTEPQVSSSILKCECGGGAIANNTHSAWCPMFIDDGDYYGTD